MPKIQITAKGIRRALKKYTPYQSICEYIWNGFDAQASKIKIDFIADEIGNISQLTISDNGYGIPHSKLQEKFEPVFESKKAIENKLKKNQSAIHGKNGIGRLTFFTFAKNASWTTVYSENGNNFTYDIFTNSENINLYTGLNSTPKITENATGTIITFSSIHSISSFHLEEKFKEYLLKEFAWFLALNKNRNFQIILNGKNIDFNEIVADQEEENIIHEDSGSHFNIRYIRWQQKPNSELSKYYYLSSDHRERWKEPTAIKNKGEHFHHSVFIESPYFDSFSFLSDDEQNQEALISGTRSDKQFKFLRKKLGAMLRIKRRPFLKVFAQKMVSEFEEKNLLAKDAPENLKQILAIMYEMQPKIFNSLNLEQKKIFIELLHLTLKSNEKLNLPEALSRSMDLTDEENKEIFNLIQ